MTYAPHFQILLLQVLTLVTSARQTTCPLEPIPSHILQSIAPDLLPFLTHLINTSLSTGCFPNSLKEARVNRLLKKSTLYRTVSLLPFLSKTLERAIFDQLSSYLHHNILPALILLQWPHLPGNLERIRVWTLSSYYWGPSRFRPGSPPLLSVHQLSWLCHSLTRLFLP